MFPFILGAVLKTIKQSNNNLINNIIVFLLSNFIWTNRKIETKLYLLPIGPNKIVQQKTIISLMKFLFRCLSVFKICSLTIGKHWTLTVTYIEILYFGSLSYKVVLKAWKIYLPAFYNSKFSQNIQWVGELFCFPLKNKRFYLSSDSPPPSCVLTTLVFFILAASV